MPENLGFFKNNVAFYSEGYKDFSLKPWEIIMVEMAAPGSEVLDVACGGGRITVPMLKKGCNVTGTDFVKEFEPRIRMHEKEFMGKFVFIDAWMNNLPFHDSSFDLVTCVNSIVYMKNAEGVRSAIAEMVRVLKPGGRLFFTSWNMLHPLWGTSIVLNYVLRRGKKFGETSPFFTTDSRSKRSRVHMFVPTRDAIKKMCRDAGIASRVYTSDGFVGNNSILTAFHPLLVVIGIKDVEGK